MDFTIENGADINAVNEKGEMKKMIATRLFNTMLVTRLKFRGADFRMFNYEGDTLLHIEVHALFVQTVAILHIFGLNFNEEKKKKSWIYCFGNREKRIEAEKMKDEVKDELR